jgi:hypothetical protein
VVGDTKLGLKGLKMQFVFSGVGSKSTISVYTALDLLSELGGFMGSIFQISSLIIAGYNSVCLEYTKVSELRVLRNKLPQMNFLLDQCID